MSEYVFVDFETTGLDPETSYVIEIGALKTDAEGNEIGRMETFLSLPNGYHVPERITKLTGISDADLEGAIPEKDGMRALYDFIGDATVVAHHAPFEIGFMRIAGGFEPKRFVCTRVVARLLEPDEKANLKYVAERYGVENNDHHRAMNDVFVTKEIFFVQKETVEREGIEYENRLFDSPERPLTFIPKHTKTITHF